MCATYCMGPCRRYEACDSNDYFGLCRDCEKYFGKIAGGFASWCDKEKNLFPSQIWKNFIDTLIKCGEYDPDGGKDCIPLQHIQEEYGELFDIEWDDFDPEKPSLGHWYFDNDKIVCIPGKTPDEIVNLHKTKGWR